MVGVVFADFGIPAIDVQRLKHKTNIVLGVFGVWLNLMKITKSHSVSRSVQRCTNQQYKGWSLGPKGAWQMQHDVASVHWKKRISPDVVEVR